MVTTTVPGRLPGTQVVLPARDLPRRPPGELLAAARHGLAEAAAAPRPAERYALAHLAALRAAAAVLAVRARPAAPGQGRRGRPASVWRLLAGTAPELSEWAAFFAAGAGKRAAAEAGIPGAVTPREADDLLRDAETFLAAVTGSLGRPHQAALPVAAPRQGP